MILKQFRYENLGQASYLVGCVRSKEASVVDPIADLGVDHYVLEAADRGLAVTLVLETHVHVVGGMVDWNERGFPVEKGQI